MRARLALAAAALLLLAGSCASGSGRRPPPADLSVRLRLEQEPRLAVAVEVGVYGDEDGETVFALASEWGGVGPDRKDLVDLRARTADGGALPVEREGPQRWRVRHARGERIVLSARVPANQLRRGPRDGHYRPLVEPDLFHGIGHLLLPLPAERDERAPIEIEVAFEGFAQQGFEAHSSFGPGNAPLRVRATEAELRGALFVAGALEVHRREIRGRPLWVTLYERDWAFDGARFADLAEQVVRLERELMDDFDVGPYWISAIDVGAPQPLGLSLGGTGLTHAFALFLQPDVTLALDSRGGLPVRRLLAHECFHEWNGQRIRLADPEERAYWFSEGFTDHFARRVLRAAGWLDAQAYAASLNELLQRYYTSPARNLPASELGQLFWTDSAAQEQPYLRGDVAAAIADAAIRRRTRGREDLADLMRALLREADGRGRGFGPDDLLERIESRVGREVAAHLRRVVLDGATAELPPDAFGPGFALEERDVFAWDPGFDVDASLEAREVRGVRPGSAAALAGLADGQRIVGFSVYRGEPERELQLTVEDAAGKRELAWLPRGAATVVPHVVVR